ncbi:MAG: leucine-rich repeat domain-containing protein, partial [Clostridia bacterium]|nr:leucine-rich repeat domain-containing protein [Clostridia bacterium]
IIPDGVTSIGDSAFLDCSELTSITIPNSVKDIGDYVFYKCSNLARITIPDSVTSVKNWGLEDTAYYNDKSNWEGDVLYNGKHLIGADSNISGEYQIKAGTLTIANHVFWYCSELTNIIIPDSVTSIGFSVFGYCEKLKDITFEGTKKQWDLIQKDKFWDWNSISSKNQYTVHCTDGNITT